MSIRLMSAAWDLDIPSTEKMVLMCLCDFADDEGRNCWPSIATLARKCSKSERTIQGAIRTLETMGYLVAIARDGKSNSFNLNPRKICTPQKTTETPADSAPKPPRTTSRGLADAKPTRARASSRIPETWMPGPLPPKVQTLADLWPPGRLERELDGFRDYWLTRPKDFRRENWDRVWWNRIRDIHDRVMRDNRHARRSPRNDDEIQNPYARVVAEREAERAGAEWG